MNEEKVEKKLNVLHNYCHCNLQQYIINIVNACYRPATLMIMEYTVFNKSKDVNHEVPVL